MEKLLSMDDVGTRQQHYIELHQLWTDALGILLRQMEIHPSECEQKQKTQLETSIKLLEAELTKDFKVWEYGRVVNELPTDPDKIKGGRNGTI
jgi:hypothetical protein